jgi:hypothetical protein
LCYQWNSEDQTIPASDEDLAMLSRLNGRWATMGAKVKACFNPLADDPTKLRNERLWVEFCRIEALREKKSAGGKHAMANRYHSKQDTTKSLARVLADSYNREQGTENREQGTEQREQGSEKKETSVLCNASVTASNASITDVTRNAPKKPVLDPDFILFWKAYPNPKGKQAALKAWQQAKTRPPIDVILKAIENQKKWPAWQKERGQYIPHPATWLNAGRWDDEPLIPIHVGNYR